MIRVVAAKSFFEDLGYAESIFPLHIDATKCVDRGDNAKQFRGSDVKMVSVCVFIGYHSFR
jgi:hypothetical protein